MKGRIPGLPSFQDEWLDDEDIDQLDPEQADSWSVPRVPSRDPGRRAPVLDWKDHLANIEAAMRPRNAAAGARRYPSRELVYIADAQATANHRALALQLAWRERRARGEWSKPKRPKIRWSEAPTLPLDDQRIIALLRAAAKWYDSWSMYSSTPYGVVPADYLVPTEIHDSLIPLLARTGRLLLRLAESEDLSLLAWDGDGAWTFSLEISASPGSYVVAGSFRRGAERMEISTPALMFNSGFLFTRDRVASFDDRGAFAWLMELASHGSFQVPRGEGAPLTAAILGLPQVPALDVAPELAYEEIRVAPQPRLRLRPGPRDWGANRLRGTLSFTYGDAVAHWSEDHEAAQPNAGNGRTLVQPERRRLVLRDAQAEAAALEHLIQIGFRPRRYQAGGETNIGLDLAARKLPGIVPALLAAGWHVVADGKLYRRPGAIRVEVKSGVDWFELHGTVEFEGRTVALPALLAALRRGDHAVLLGDGTYGVLPEDWLRKYGFVGRVGTVTDGHVRFTRSQAGLLDAFLAAAPEIAVDEIFARARDELKRFEGIEPSDAPPEFAGQLRGYQREGLGWLYFLRRFGFGGCLADDMGLGKTVQVLALLEARRQARERDPGSDGPRPSLVVVPRSLVFNWKAEAARFTPKLRVLDHTGVGRERDAEQFDAYDVVITTYGTLRRDITRLKDLRFDSVILDEAQAIKNAETDSAKAARLLRADHKLALSGTPVQNHLGELWSLFEFLNPGMLGKASALALNGAGTLAPDDATRDLLARAIRPFILRRTKEQVARDLPAKLEQTLYCELDAEQRARYDELRDHYRQALLARADREGLARLKIQVLEALLRLRQAACHPGLLDHARVGATSAKLEVLRSRLAEVVDQGHKALVFSQFTSFLAIVRKRLHEDGIEYEYLDGQTRDRATPVERFQRDPGCRLFLVSLKAGGLGLNLTAAEYVFLLDPWWNPAVEAQAIDRTHRIGQDRPVFAYRLIVRDTVEEKVLELQAAKRELADAIIKADDGLIRSLSRKDLELLLS